MRPNCTIGLVSYKRPLFLAECIKSMYHKPGMPFELLIWSNDIKNEGSYALERIFRKVKTKYFVVVEEDEIWFQDNWLKDLVEAFEQTPDITEEGRKMGYKNEWGCLATNTLSDEVNGSPKRYEGLIHYSVGRFTYWANIRPGGGAMIYKTEVLRSLNAFEKPKHKNGVLYPLTLAYEKAKYPCGRIENIYIYHAFSEYWNGLYPEVYKEKQNIEIKTDLNSEPMRTFLKGNFDKYAEHLNNGK